MEINIDLTRDDYADFNKYYFLKKGLKKRIYIVIIVAFGLPLVINSGRPFYLYDLPYNRYNRWTCIWTHLPWRNDIGDKADKKVTVRQWLNIRKEEIYDY